MRAFGKGRRAVAGSLCVAVLQFPLPDAGPAGGRAAWAEALEARAQAVAQAGAGLAVFPPGAGAGPEGVAAFAVWTRAGRSPGRSRRAVPPADAWVAYCALGSVLARRARAFLVPGSVVVPHEGGSAHAAGLFSPEGDLVLAQSQGTWPAEAIAAGWRPADELRLAEAAGFRVAILLGWDAVMPESHRIAERLGATLTLALTAWPWPYNPWRQLAGAWAGVQETQVPCAEACLVGPVRGRLFAGRSAVYAPCEATPGETGWLARLTDARGEGLALAELDPQAVARVREAYPIAAFLNQPLYARHFPRIYGGLAAEAGRAGGGTAEAAPGPTEGRSRRGGRPGA